MKTKSLAPTVAVALLLFAVPAARAGEPSTPAVAPTRGKEVLVIKNSQDAQTFNAEDQDVTVNGSGNKVTIKGTCHALTISGDKNAVTVAAVATITVSGEENQVLWSKTVEGTKPQITDTGKGNQVTHSDARTE